MKTLAILALGIILAGLYCITRDTPMTKEEIMMLRQDYLEKKWEHIGVRMLTIRLRGPRTGHLRPP